MLTRKVVFEPALILAASLLFGALCAAGALGAAQGPPAVSATAIPEAQIQVAELARILTSNSVKPLVLQVGPKVFFQEGSIEGARYAGPGSRPEGLQLLEKTVAGLPKDQFIVIYCGCCPWNKCPNVGPALAHLRELGYTNVKVLHLANNFGDDWVRKGYPQQR